MNTSKCHTNEQCFLIYFSAVLFGAFSLTLHDWTKVLLAIKEETLIQSKRRTLFLIVINAVSLIISCINFTYCYEAQDLDSYAQSDFYVLELFVQIASPLFLAVMMIRAGRKLSVRIKGAAGGLDTSKTKSPQDPEFKSALWRLNAVMCVCLICISFQVSGLYKLFSVLLIRPNQ